MTEACGWFVDCWLWSFSCRYIGPVEDLGFLEGGFTFRRISTNNTRCYIAPVSRAAEALALVMQSTVEALYTSMQRLRSSRCADKLGSLRSHLLAFQALYSKRWSCGRRVCWTCSPAPSIMWVVIFIDISPTLSTFKRDNKSSHGQTNSFLLCSWLVKLTISDHVECQQSQCISG